MSERLPLLSSNFNFPLDRGAERVELVELRVLVVILLPVDWEVYRGREADRLNADCSDMLFSFDFSFICGTPSHLELTFGTVGGSLAEETPGNPTAFARPL